MKRILNKIAYSVVVTAVAMTSCKSLDVDPTGFYSGENFYNSIEEANSALFYAYDGLTYNTYTQSAMYFGDLASDNCNVKLSEGADAVAIVNWDVTSQNNILLNLYRSLYITINRANAVIENVPGKGFDQTAADQLVGEAYFLRAWSHFSAVKMFGLVPLQRSLIDKLDETNANLATDLNEAYTFIIEDLTKAIELLQINRIMGRADKVAAQALLAKVYLFAASAKESSVPKYDAITQDVDALYALAAEYAGYVLFDQSTYGHDTSLTNIYDVEAFEVCPEHIFTISFDRSGIQEGDYSALSKYYIPWIAGGTIYIQNVDGTVIPTHDGWSVMETAPELLLAYGENDLRRQELMVRDIYDADGVKTGSVSTGEVLYEFTRKFIDPEFEGDKTSTRPYLLRYSDIQLVYAEATADAEGLAQLNQIRTRAGLTAISDSEFAALSKSDFRDAVVDERQKELAFEWDRLWDLRRKNIVSEKVVKAAGLTPEALAFYPLPQREIDLNPNI